MGNLSFPKDHFGHDGVDIEWWYFNGRLSNGLFFHFARFATKVAGFRGGAVHLSLHDGESKYFEELPDDFDQTESVSGFIPGRHGNPDRFYFQFKRVLSLTCFPENKPVVHNVTHDRNYYSIPHLKAEGYLLPEEKVTADVWFDHEFSKINRFKEWDWISLKLQSGAWAMVYDCDIDRFCTVGLGDKTVQSAFILEGDRLSINELGMELSLQPTVKEEVFDPRFGVKYSEVPITVLTHEGEKIGHGMRERTHHMEINYGWNK
jgi:predicted secreted hydrolase